MVSQRKNKKLRSLVWWILIIIIIANLLIYLVPRKQYFFRPFDPQYYADLYSHSPYVLGPAATEGISDDGLYTFAGYYYFFQRGDVSAVNFEHPPLGKYLIGLSIFLFQNENIINIIYFFILLFTTYHLGKLILKNRLLAMIPVVLLSFDPLFLDNLIRSLLDLPFTLFFILGIYFFILGLKNEKFFYLSMLFRGMSFSTRFYPAGIIIYLYLFLIVLLFSRKKIFTFIASSFLVPAVYLVSHISFFVYHPSLIEFLRHKKWMLAWFSGSISIPGNIWRNIYTGYYIDTTENLVKNKEWAVSVPVIITSALLPLKKIVQPKDNLNLFILYGLCVIYLLYVTALTDGVEKFIMPIFPILCILAVQNCVSLYSIITSWMRRK